MFIGFPCLTCSMMIGYILPEIGFPVPIDWAAPFTLRDSISVFLLCSVTYYSTKAISFPVARDASFFIESYYHLRKK